jgi:recombinational DNA repair ATPase RecF
LRYQPALFSDRPFSETTLLEDLDRAETAEIRSRRSIIGPQRDRFEVAVNGRKLQLFSSGEKKKYLLMLYMAYIDMFRRTRDEYPVLLLDDYDAVMDERNLEFVLDHFPAMQVIATSVAANERFESCIELKKE